MNKLKLKPCPFCGSENLILDSKPEYHTLAGTFSSYYSFIHYVKCLHTSDKKISIFEKWNNRQYKDNTHEQDYLELSSKYQELKDKMNEVVKCVNSLKKMCKTYEIRISRYRD